MYWVMTKETDKNGSFHHVYGNMGSPFETTEAAQEFIETSLMHVSGDCLARDCPYKIDGNTITIEKDYWGTTRIEYFVVRLEICSDVQKNTKDLPVLSLS